MRQETEGEKEKEKAREREIEKIWVYRLGSGRADLDPLTLSQRILCFGGAGLRRHALCLSLLYL